jgi:hypothetical protein
MWGTYCQQNFRATVGETPSRVRWDYREGVSLQWFACYSCVVFM